MQDGVPRTRTAARVVRVFISSTFRDMHAERDRLNRFVFLELRRRCALQGADFVGIDLRWGVTPEDARRRGSLNICLDEIDRARPFFVGLIGERYGWVPPADEVGATIFRESKSQASEEDAALLDEWYKLDETVEPAIYRLSKAGPMPEDVNDRLVSLWESAGLPAAGQSITERELRYGGMEAPAGTRALIYMRRPDFLDDPDFPASFRSVFVEGQPERREKLLQLKSGLKTHHPVREYDAHYDGLQIDLNLLDIKLSREDEKRLRDGVIQPAEWSVLSEPLQQAFRQHGTVRLKGLDVWGDSLLEELWGVIEAELPKGTTTTSDRSTLSDAHELFLQDRTRLFLGREDALAEMFRYVDNRKLHRPLVVTGPPGSGKSALIAEFALRCRKRSRRTLVLPFFIGASPGSTDLITVLRSLCEKLRTSLRLRIPVPTEPDEIRIALHSFLKRAGARGPVILLLDALDQMDPGSGSHELDWLPMQLPPNVRFIVSTLPGKALDSLRERVPPDAVFPLEPLSIKERELLISRLLESRGKKLTAEQVGRLLDVGTRPDAALPLYLRVALEELSLFGEYAAVSDRIDRLPATIPELFEQVLIRLEADHGRDLSEQVLRSIAVSRSGLRESEILDLLESSLPRCTRLDWTRFYRALMMYLRPMDESTGVGLVGFYHEQLRLAVSRRYLSTNRVEQRRSQAFRRAHAELAVYFEKLARDGPKPPGWNSEQQRGLSEVVWHQTRAELWEDLERTLTDLEFVEAKCLAGMTYELIGDYTAAIEALPEAQTEAREEAQSEERVGNYAAAMAAYARAWNGGIDQHRADANSGSLPNPKETPLPELPPTSQAPVEEKDSQPRASIRDKSRLGRLRAFASFVAGESQSLARWIGFPDFCLQQAHNDFESGPVGNAADELKRSRKMKPLSLLCHPKYRSQYDPDPIILRTLTGGSGDIGDAGQDTSGVAVTADGRVAVSTFGTSLNVWDLLTGRRLRILDEDGGWAQAVAMTPDGRRAVCGYGDDLIRVWDVATGTCLRRLAGHEDRPMTVAITADGRIGASGAQDRTVRIWDLERELCIRTLEGHENEVTSIALSANGRTVVSGSEDQTVRVWDVTSGVSLAIFRPRIGGIRALAATRDARLVVVAGNSGACQIWDVATRSRLTRLKSGVEGPKPQAESLAVTADDRRIVSGYFGNVNIWSIETGEHLQHYWPPAGSVAPTTQVAVTADARRVITVSYDGTVQVWDVDRGWHEPTEDETAASGNVEAVAFRGNGREAASCDREGVFLVHDLRTGSQAFSTLKGGRDASSIALTPDGSRALIASPQHFSLYTVSNGFASRPRELGGHDGTVQSVSISVDGRIAVSGADDRTVRVWDLVTAQCRSILRGHLHGVTAVAFGADGRLMVSGGDDDFGKSRKSLMSWTLGTGKRVRVFKGTTDRIETLALSEDGQLAVSGGTAGVVSVWSVRKGALLKKLVGHSDSITGVAITPSGRNVISASRDRTIRVWDLDSGECVAVCVQPFVVLSLALRGRHLIIGGQSGNVRILDLGALPADRPVVTAIRVYEFARKAWAKRLEAFCNWCDRQFKPPLGVMETIERISRRLRREQSPCLDLDLSAFVDPALEATCPYCKNPVRFNPFAIENPLGL